MKYAYASETPGAGQNAGMTLLDMTMAVSLMTIILGALLCLSMVIGDSAHMREERATAFDEARKAMITVTREIRQAARSRLSTLPGATISYVVPTDIDGNGLAVDRSGRPEMSALRTISRDSEDLNQDGVTDSQVVMMGDGDDDVLVLANRVLPDEDLNKNNVLDDGEDINGNGLLDRGLWFEQTDARAVRITLQTAGRTRRGHVLSNRVSTMITPRN